MLSVVVPCYNEAEGVEATIRTLVDVLAELNAPYELLIVSDGSRDKTFDIVASLSKENPDRIKGIEFSRNFGKEAAMLAGLAYAKGNCAVTIDGDLQHPPQTILEMYKMWQQGYDIVEGIKEERQKETWLHRISAVIFYKIFDRALGMDLGNASDFKLIDRRVIDVLLALPERSTFYRGLTFWTGFPSAKVEYHVNPRTTGTTKWSTMKLIKYAVNNIVSFSSMPLSIITMLSVIMLFLALWFGLRALRLYFTDQAAGGITTVVVLQLLIGGLILLALSIIGRYIAGIFDEIKGRPRYLVDKTVGSHMDLGPVGPEQKNTVDRNRKKEQF